MLLKCRAGGQGKGADALLPIPATSNFCFIPTYNPLVVTVKSVQAVLLMGTHDLDE